MTWGHKNYVFASGVEGLTVAMTFTQQEGDTLEMHCVISTDLSAVDTLKKFCTDPNPPEIWLVKGYSDCGDLPNEGEVSAEKVGTVQKPSKIWLIVSTQFFS